MDYVIVHATTPQELAARVKSYLAKGWKLQGGVAIRSDQGRDEYAQAMIKEPS